MSATATLTTSEITAALNAIPDGKAVVISDRCVLREHGGFQIEGFGKRLIAWNRAVEILRKPMHSRRAA